MYIPTKKFQKKMVIFGIFQSSNYLYINQNGLKRIKLKKLVRWKTKGNSGNQTRLPDKR